jgi:hypothetical protein
MRKGFNQITYWSATYFILFTVLEFLLRASPL